MSPATFSVKNFERFQHYKDRAPPWIKLYNELLDDYEFGSLPDASKMHLIAIWLLASRSENKLPYDPTWIEKRINATEPVNLKLLAETGFIIVDQALRSVEQHASTPLAERLPRERGEGEKDTPSLRSGDAASASLSSKDKCWLEGKATLQSLGVSERQAGSMIGKWMRDTGEDADAVLGAIQRAREHGTGEPIPFVTRLLKPSTSNRQHGKSTAALARELSESDDPGGFFRSERPVRLISG